MVEQRISGRGVSTLSPGVRGVLLSALALVLLGLWLGRTTGLLRGRPMRWMLFGASALALALVVPWAGLDLVYLKRLELFLAAVAALLALAARPSIGPLLGRWGMGPNAEPEARDSAAPPRHLGPAGVSEAARYRRAWVALTGAAALTWLNFFSFHGERTFVHYHDVAHYYLGSKYLPELGYEGLYTAMLRAESEVYGGVSVPEARDLETNELVPVAELFSRSDVVRSRFGAERWGEFLRDVAWFRDALGPLYGAVLRDHGFNPSPAWVLLGAPLANVVPASSAGIVALSLLDPLLLIAAFAAIGRTFGLLPLLQSATAFFLVFGAGFAWTGGAFLRQPWLAAVLAAVCALERRRAATAGVLVGLATALRVFPAVFLVAPACAVLWEARERRIFPRRLLRLGGGFVLGAGGLLLATAALPGGAGQWREFTADLAVHAETPAPNLVGLTPILAWRPGPEPVDPEDRREMRARRTRIHRFGLVVLLPLVAATVAYRSRGAGAAEAMALGAPLLFVGASSASYYWAFLPLLVLAFRSDPGKLAWYFAVETASYAVLLFAEGEELVYVWRSVLLLALFTGLWWAGAGARGSRGRGCSRGRARAPAPWP